MRALPILQPPNPFAPRRNGDTMKAAWQLWRDRRGRLSPLRIGTLGAVAVSARQGAVRRRRHRPRRAADQRPDPSRRLLGAGVPRRDAGGHAVPPHRALRQSDRRAAHARRRHLLLHRRASLAVISPTRCSTSARSCTRSPIAGISSSAAPPGSAWRCWPSPRPTAWCAGSAACAGAGCIRSSTPSRCWR